MSQKRAVVQGSRAQEMAALIGAISAFGPEAQRLEVPQIVEKASRGHRPTYHDNRHHAPPREQGKREMARRLKQMAKANQP